MLEFLINDKFVSENDRLAVGVSGGADSMVLLWALLDKQKQVGFHIHVVHVNHNLRGADSDSDSEFVKAFCEKKKIDYSIVNVDVKKLKIDSKLTLEESARIARYDAFSKIMKKEKLNKLVLAHHKNDQVETILMHIFRGSGVSGASGIRQSENIVRPLLNLDKNEILKIAKDHGVKFVTDLSNLDNSYARNFIRNEILPTIQKVYPGVVDSVCEFGERCKELDEFVCSLVNEDLIDSIDNGFVIKDVVFDNNKVLVYQYIKRVFQKLGIFADIESKHYELIMFLSKAEVNKSIDLPHKIIAKKTYDGIKFLKQTKKDVRVDEKAFLIGTVEIEGFGKILTQIVSPDEVVYGEGALFADYAKISNGAVWRFRRQGDIFSKLGTGSKKLNDYFTDKKVEFEKRNEIPILAVGNKVLIVAPNDISENVKIDGNTEQIVKIEFLR